MLMTVQNRRCRARQIAEFCLPLGRSAEFAFIGSSVLRDDFGRLAWRL